MTYLIYKLKFTSGIHFGDSQIGQESTMQTMKSDTFFSAVYSEYMRIYGDDELENIIEKIKISDLLPYKNDNLFVPKPFVAIDRDISPTNENKIDRKKIKALQYIPMNKFKQYLDFLRTGENFPEDIDDDFGKKQIITKNQISRTGDDTQIYSVEVFKFCEDSGLYFILDCPDDFAKKFENTIQSLGYMGIGAKKSVGLGKFEIKEIKSLETTDPNTFSEIFFENSKQNSNNSDNISYLVLSSYLPTEKEIPMLKEKSYYRIIKSSGFINIPSYSDEAQKRRQVYMISSGAVLGFCPIGRVVDLKLHGKHSIYRLAKPIVLEVSI